MAAAAATSGQGVVCFCVAYSGPAEFIYNGQQWGVSGVWIKDLKHSVLVNSQVERITCSYATAKKIKLSLDLFEMFPRDTSMPTDYGSIKIKIQGHANFKQGANYQISIKSDKGSVIATFKQI